VPAPASAAHRAPRAEHLASGHVQEAEGGFVSFSQTAQVAAHGFEQVEGADDVGLHKVTRAVNGSDHMALGRKVAHGAGLALGQQAFHQSAVASVALHKDMARVALQTGQGF
jgi:hypothetical protein